MTMTQQLHTPVPYQPRRDVVSRQLAANDHDRWRLRAPAFIVIAVIIVAAAIGFASDAAASSPFDASSGADTIEIYVVQPGDTLWEIAGTIATDGEDLRPIVDALQEASGGSSLEIGQRIVIDHTLIRN